MTRFILLAIILFVAITFFFIALKGVLRRIIGMEAPQAPLQSKHRVVYKKDNVVVLQGEAEPDLPPNTP